MYGYDAAGRPVGTVRGATGEYLGKWIETADLDGDGALDLVIGGARAANEDAPPTGGVARIRLSGSGEWFDLPRPDGSRNFGYRVVAGDATGDGVPELIVADPYWGRTIGAAYLYEGPVRPGATPACVLRGDTAYAEVPLLGRGIDFGDVDGDGVQDFVIGQSAWAVWTDEARVYLFRGGPIDRLPGTGRSPRIARAPAAHAAFGSPEIGNIGEYAVIPPLAGPPGGPEQVLATILHAGRHQWRGAYVFQMPPLDGR